MRSKIAISSALAALAFSGNVLAQGTGFYGGIGVGQSKVELNSADFGPAAGETVSIDDKDTAWKFFGGYKFTQNFAAELGYAKLGEFSARFADAGGDLFTDNYEATSWNLAAVGTLPLSGSFSVLGKLGLTRNENELSSSDGSSTKDTESRLFWGVGAQYDFSPRVGVRLEYEDFGRFGSAFVDDPVTGNFSGSGRAEVTMVSLSLIARF